MCLRAASADKNITYKLWDTDVSSAEGIIESENCTKGARVVLINGIWNSGGDMSGN